MQLQKSKSYLFLVCHNLSTEYKNDYFHLKNNIGGIHDLDELFVESLGRSVSHVMLDFLPELKSRVVFKLLAIRIGHNTLQTLKTKTNRQLIDYTYLHTFSGPS